MASVTPIGSRAARALEGRRRDIQFRWIQRVVTGEPYSLRPSLTLPAALGQIGVILDGLITAVRSGRPPSPELPETALRQGVRRHAELRASQGFGVEALVAEFRALRAEVWHVLAEELVDRDSLDLRSAFRLVTVVDYAVDTLMLGSVAAWLEVEERDRAEARPHR